jgi:hypothetical protein
MEEDCHGRAVDLQRPRRECRRKADVPVGVHAQPVYHSSVGLLRMEADAERQAALFHQRERWSCAQHRRSEGPVAQRQHRRNRVVRTMIVTDARLHAGGGADWAADAASAFASCGHAANQGRAAVGHVWTAPGWQGISSRLQQWSEQPCVRPVSAAHVTAGHNALRGSGPGQFHAFDNAVAQVGCPDRRIDRLCITCCSPFPTVTSRRMPDAISFTPRV